MKTKAEHTFEKLALNMRLSKLKPLLKEMSDSGIKLTRNNKESGLKKIKGARHDTGELASTHIKYLGSDSEGYKTVHLGMEPVSSINIPKTKNRVLRRLTRSHEDKVTGTLAHELGHAKKYKELFKNKSQKVTADEIIYTNKHGKKLGISTGLDEGLLVPKGKHSIDSIKTSLEPAKEREAWVEAGKLVKKHNIPVDKKVINKNATNALNTYYRNGYFQKVNDATDPKKLLKYKRTVAGGADNRIMGAYNGIKKYYSINNKEKFFK